MKIREVTILIIGLCTLFILPAYAGPYTGKKIFHVCSYHEGYEWSDGVKEGIDEVLAGKGIILKTFDMDTKNKSSEKQKKQAGLKAKKIIDEFGPDLIITSDDNAFKYVIMPYYRDAEIPVVFCGINLDASDYGAPYPNTTGILEFTLIEEVLKDIFQYADGERVGSLSGDTYTAKKEIGIYKNEYGIDILDRYARDFEQWKRIFVEIQEQVDVLIFFNNAAIAGWNDEEAVAFVNENTKIPTASNIVHMAKYVLVSFARSPQEQGRWAGETALRVLDGEKPADIPIAKSKKGPLYLNLNIADKLGIVFSPFKLKHAEIVP